MRNASRRLSAWCVVILVIGGLLVLTGCDPTTRAAVEDGIIDASTGFVGAFLQALIELAGEQQQQSAALLIDSVAHLCA